MLLLLAIERPVAFVVSPGAIKCLGVSKCRTLTPQWYNPKNTSLVFLLDFENYFHNILRHLNMNGTPHLRFVFLKAL